MLDVLITVEPPGFVVSVDRRSVFPTKPLNVVVPAVFTSSEFVSPATLSSVLLKVIFPLELLSRVVSVSTFTASLNVWLVTVLILDVLMTVEPPAFVVSVDRRSVLPTKPLNVVVPVVFTSSEFVSLATLSRVLLNVMLPLALLSRVVFESSLTASS